MDILIIDDHTLFRNGLNYLLRELEKNIIVHEHSNTNSAIRELKTDSQIDLVLLDLKLPGSSGLCAIQQILEGHPNLPVVIMTGSNNITDMKQAFHLGAKGYITKDESPEIMLSAIKLVLSGGIYIPSKFTQYQEHYANHDLNINLTPKQREVLKYIQEGLSNKQIADNMKLALSTIKVHTTAIFKELGVKNRTQAVLSAHDLDI